MNVQFLEIKIDKNSNLTPEQQLQAQLEKFFKTKEEKLEIDHENIADTVLANISRQAIEVIEEHRQYHERTFEEDVIYTSKKLMDDSISKLHCKQEMVAYLEMISGVCQELATEIATS